MRTLPIALLCAIVAAPAPAQTTAPQWESDGCVKAQAIIPAARCALILSDEALLRGAPPGVVAVETPTAAIPLRKFVRGDSALHYALKYERQTRAGLALKLAGGGVLFAESIAIVSGMAKTTTDAGKVNVPVAAVMMSGLGALGASVGIRWLARGNGERAVAEYNRGLSRE